MRFDIIPLKTTALLLPALFWAAPDALATVSRETNPLTWLQSFWAGLNLELAAVYVIWGLVALVLIAVVFGWDQEEKPAPAKTPPVSDIYGSAAWAQPRKKPRSQTEWRGVFFGKSSHPGMNPKEQTAPVYSQIETHSIVVSRTRSGKGTRVINPTLLRYDHSMLVIDPKGECGAISARTRRDYLKQTVHIVNPWGVLESHYKDLGFETATYNPLDAIDRNDPNAVALAQSMAATICPITPGKEAYWQGSAANVLAGVFLWLIDRPDQPKTLGRARELVTQSRADFKKTLAQMMSSTAFHGAIKEMVSQYIDLADETYSGIMSNLAESTKFLSDPQIKKTTATSSFSLDSIRQRATTIYLVIPHERIQTHATWLRLIISSAMHAIKKQSTSPKYRVMFLIDEFGSLGHIPDIPRDIAIMSGYGLDFAFIVQGLEQLRNHYGDAAGTILNNCAYQWFCNISELETAKYLSDTLGKKTVQTISKGQSTSMNQKGEQEGQSTTYGETGRPLLTPDEILNLGRDVAILLNPLGKPCYLQPVDYWNAAKLFEFLHPNYPDHFWPGLDATGTFRCPAPYDPNPYIEKVTLAQKFIPQRAKPKVPLQQPDPETMKQEYIWRMTGRKNPPPDDQK